MSVAWSTYRQCAALIREGAVLVKGHDSRPTKNPAFSVMRQAAAEMELCGSALGLSPYARTRIPQPDQADDDDPLALLLGPEGRAWAREVNGRN
jgi:P27 family predicted phage terminase small subunit